MNHKKVIKDPRLAGSGIYLADKPVLPEVRRSFARQREVRVIVGLTNGTSPSKAREYLKTLGIRVHQGGTEYYLFATITEEQADKLDKENAGSCLNCFISKVWLDKIIRAMVDKSQTTINAQAARSLFGKNGKDIHWAVLDTGIFADHDWLKGKVAASPGTNYTSSSAGDRVGHGTHVAGIISKIAPEVTLHDYKVLDDEGLGSSSGIIQAMHDIRKLNFDQGQTVVHGVNLSLGGAVEVASYGCGASPECQEANRLMLSGVVVCVAAGNDGHKILATVGVEGKLAFYPTFMDVGIADPGNAEEIITVGSVHSSHPHVHGVSYFSSKGPTGDGRAKPDVVAPGEKIASASIDNPSGTTVMSGTSMATPHVSGAIALFLSSKPEFIGHATEIKKILMSSCTDLKRDRYFQGAGLVDVLRMIQSI